MKWHEGQEVFLAYDGSRGRQYNRHEKITKVGRKWATCANKRIQIRFDIETGNIDGDLYSSPGKAWESEAAYLAELRRRNLGESLRKAVSGYGYGLLPYTTEQVLAAAKCLGIELERDK